MITRETRVPQPPVVKREHLVWLKGDEPSVEAIHAEFHRGCQEAGHSPLRASEAGTLAVYRMVRSRISPVTEEDLAGVGFVRTEAPIAVLCDAAVMAKLRAVLVAARRQVASQRDSTIGALHNAVMAASDVVVCE